VVLHPLFTEEHEELRRSIRAFVESELAPHAEDWEREGFFPDWVFKRMGDLGFLGLRYPPEYGGKGGYWGHSIVMAEEMARVGSGGVGMAVAVQAEMATPPDPPVRDRRAEAAVPGAGHPRRKDRVPGDHRARRGLGRGQYPDHRGPGRGRLGDQRPEDVHHQRQAGDYCVLVARTDKPAGYEGFSLLLVDTDLPGFSVSRTLDKLGMHSSDTAELVLDEVRVPATALLGQEGKGFEHIMWELQGERLVGAAGSVAGAWLAFERTLEHAKERRAFGRPIGSFSGDDDHMSSQAKRNFDC
jgi:acyl-CoA dehydrogenase